MPPRLRSILASRLVEPLEPRLLLSIVPTPRFSHPHLAPETLPAVFTGGTNANGQPSLTQAFALQSDPGAPWTLFLDFKGLATSVRWSNFTVPPQQLYDLDGNPTTFNQQELDNIVEIWERVAEKFSPFNINVSTVTPPALVGPNLVTAVIEGNGYWYAGGQNDGGVALVTGATSPNANDHFAWVFSDNLAAGNPKSVAEATAHEVGHLFGLDHQASFDAQGNLLNAYSTGDGLTAPIMGDSNDAVRGLWWNGLSPLKKPQDDLAMLSTTLGYRIPDLVGHTPGTATPETVSNGAFAVDGLLPTNGAQDAFSFVTGSGTVTLSATGAPYGAMLLPRLRVYDAAGNLLDDTDAHAAATTLTDTLGDGKYEVVVSGDGYGNLGQFHLAATGLADSAKVTNERAYVTGLYNSLFNRTPDAGGLALWTGQLESGWTFQQVAAAIIGSREYQGGEVHGFYQTYLGRSAEPAGQTAWVNLMQQGLSAEDVQASILGSDEYFTRTGGTATAFVTALYRAFLNRDPEPQGLAFWTNAAGDTAAGREAVARAIAGSPEEKTTLIETYYATYLNRPADSAGLSAWVSLLQSGVATPTVLSEFLSTGEYLSHHGVTAQNAYPY